MKAIYEPSVGDFMASLRDPAVPVQWWVERIVTVRENNWRGELGGHDADYEVVVRFADGKTSRLYGHSYLFHGPNGLIWSGEHRFAKTRAASKEASSEDPTAFIIVYEPNLGDTDVHV